MNHQHVTVLGGGSIGLSIAYELLCRSHKVTLIDRNPIGRAASWAGAGILSPANEHHSMHPMDRLAGWSSRLHAEWVERLRAETGTDVEYWKCGGVYLARSTGEVAALTGLMEAWRDEQIPFETLDGSALRAHVGPQFQAANQPQLAVWNPIEAQIRNPYFLKTLRTAIEHRGGKLVENAGAIRLETQAGRIARIHSDNGGKVEPDQVCIAAGAWSYELLQTAGINLPVEPIRGQMVLFKLPEPPFECIVNEGSRYLVPRRDGHVLAGSTMEHVGFDCSTTEPEIDELIAFASSLFPVLNRDNVVKQWAGLRPASYDGLPYIGRLAGLSNALVATGHLRSGLQLAPATANVIADLFANDESHELFALLSPNRVSVTTPLQSKHISTRHRQTDGSWFV